MDISAFRIFTEPQQGASYEDLLAVARRAEALGFGGFFRSDHYLKMGPVSGLPGPTDALITLAGLARDTSTIRLGTLVCSATFRHAGVLAISAAEIDNMSGGRLELGLGAGWYGQEHESNGIPFPPLGERFDVLEDQLAVLTGMWGTPDGETFNYQGRTLSVVDSPGLPKPTQRPHPPIIVGGQGKKRTPMLAAKYADEFNRAFATTDNFVELSGAVRAACTEIGRDPASLVYSMAHLAVVGTDESEFRRRATAIGRDAEEVRQLGVTGTVSDAIARLRLYAEAGAERIYLQILDLHDLDHLDLLAAEVIPAV